NRRRRGGNTVFTFGLALGSSTIFVGLLGAPAPRTGLAQNLEPVLQIGHAAGITSVAFNPNGLFFVTGSGDGTAILWETSTGNKVRSFEGHRGMVLAVAFTPNGRHLLTGSEDHLAMLWDAASGQLVGTFEMHSLGVTSIAVSRDGKYVLTGSRDGAAVISDLA